MKTKICKELNIEFTLEQQQNNKKFSEIEIPEGWKIFDIPLFIKLWNIKECREEILKANNSKIWIFLENFDYLKEKYVAWFSAYSDRADLNCNRYPVNSLSALGVLFYRSLSLLEKEKPSGKRK